MAKLRCAVAMLALSLAACASAPAARPAVAAVAVDAPVADGPAAAATLAVRSRLLPVWSVESPDGRVSHVLGTFHAGVGLDEALTSAHMPALDGARVVIVELDMTGADASAVVARSMLPPHRDLSTLISAEAWPRLVEALASTIPEQALRRLAPWVVMSALMVREATALQAERTELTGEGAPSGLDTQIIERARAHGVEVSPLETMDEQAAMMEGLPLPYLVSYIESVVTGSEPEGPSMRELMDAYLRGDQAELEALVFDPVEIARSPYLFEELIYARNDRWLAPLTAQLAQGGAFVAVGLAHVIGERGLLRLLEQRGYRATRLFVAEQGVEAQP